MYAAFKNRKPSSNLTNLSIEKKIEIQASLLTQIYQKCYFGVLDIQQILGIGETNAYKLLKDKSCKVVHQGSKKVVSAVELATYLTNLEENSPSY